MTRIKKIVFSDGTAAPWYRGWHLTEAEREKFRRSSIASQAAKLRAIRGECILPKHPIHSPLLNPKSLMPRQAKNGLSYLSLFSGGGGLDLGFDLAGYSHVASYDILPIVSSLMGEARPGWQVFAGDQGDVRSIDWLEYRGKVDVLHGGPPCQPFSHAGRGGGGTDIRDMLPEIIKAIKAVRPKAFVIENVAGLLTKRFEDYRNANIYTPLKRQYTISSFVLDAASFGVPQRRKRVFFVGLQNQSELKPVCAPRPTHSWSHFDVAGLLDDRLPKTFGVRKALGFADTGYDSLAPTLRSGLTGPRYTTSVLNSVSGQKTWADLGIWPNGVAETRAAASAFVTINGNFRLSIPDCLLIQGFPDDWPIRRPVYMALGLIGNSVAPPVAYHVALAVAQSLQERQHS